MACRTCEYYKKVTETTGECHANPPQKNSGPANWPAADPTDEPGCKDYKRSEIKARLYMVD